MAIQVLFNWFAEFLTKMFRKRFLGRRGSVDCNGSPIWEMATTFQPKHFVFGSSVGAQCVLPRTLLEFKRQGIRYRHQVRRVQGDDGVRRIAGTECGGLCEAKNLPLQKFFIGKLREWKAHRKGGATRPWLRDFFCQHSMLLFQEQLPRKCYADNCGSADRP